MGNSPLLVDFTDFSQGEILLWEWDFQNDGITDSYDQNPTFTYESPGEYSVKLSIYDSTMIPVSEIKEDFIQVFPSGINFTPIWESPYNPMTFYILEATIDELPLQAGDEVGLFDIDPITGEEICVGAGLLVEELGGDVYLEMIASMDDGSTLPRPMALRPVTALSINFIVQMPAK